MKFLFLYISVIAFLADSLKIKGAYYDVKVEDKNAGSKGKLLVNRISKNLYDVTPAFKEPKKIALIIAIGSYNKEETGWRALHSANDLAMIRPVLVNQGFLNENIFTIQDAACTKAGIINAIRTKLIEPAMPGDIIYLHYSGHGFRLDDTSGDETDRIDEVLVPINASIPVMKTFKTEKYLLDDEVGKLLNTIRSKVGPSGEVIFTVDACHSGTVTRVEPTSTHSFPKESFEEKYGYIEFPYFPEENLNLAPFVVFSSSSYDEASDEIYDDNHKPVGAFSYAFSKAFASVKAKSSYRALFEEIQSIMSVKVPSQTPQVEGNIDRLILGARSTER